MSIRCGDFSPSKKPRMFFPPTVSSVDFDRARTTLLLARAEDNILLTRPAGLSGGPAVRDPSKRMIPFLTEEDRISWVHRSTWFLNFVRTLRVLTESPPKTLESSSLILSG